MPSHVNFRGHNRIVWDACGMLCCFVLVGIGCEIFTGQYAQAHEIAILKSANITAYNEAIAAFKRHLPDRFTPTLEYDAQGDLGRGRRLAKRIRASEVDVVLAVGLKAALAARLEVVDTPVVFCMVLNAEKYNLIGGRVLGIRLDIPFSDQIKPLRLIAPDWKRIGVLYDPSKTGHLIQKAQAQAQSLGIALIPREITSEKEVPDTLRSLIPQVQALWLVPDSTVLNEDSLDFLLRTTLEAGIPIVGFSRGLVRSGALVAAYIDYQDVGRQAADLVKALADGVSQAPEKLVPPQRIRWAVNVKIADFLGLPVPPRILEKFDERF